ncbi:N19M, NADH-ubiquinone oxidoreductase 9.5 kDa subunit [Boletus edulis]|uniref:N19M, NADH-ubiquinone oxidoreductase 9.5 kDa subunit n=1 Tax=Boletus edulis BED1 TaxID=1328754 RepID=A0AAD4B8L0_BOLED|nr:N19M, NADH-ubiquinone oxidoreductase 9.5 kDa subunit [Boletus edulis]KAF8414490.1 N19M, NADH-ubiquinone oxidoreductase 9.5 kDa subunit [Boletus edulis BED1]KAF8442318.1 N19M, NADH-ubiquinone oxidoreductase 9.5 kDa subunit [Boletus edulis BED1]
MASLVSPFRRTCRYLQYLAHEQPVIFWSCLLGTAGPVLAFTVPSIRQKYFGYVPAERVPTTYPLPKRPRRPVQGYEDE